MGSKRIYPTLLEWEQAVEGISLEGKLRSVEFFCPDGSSASLDNIEGITIGVSGTEYRVDLPANRHDFFHWYSRNHRYPWCTRKQADEDYRDGCLTLTSVLVGYSGWKARRRCWARYYMLRVAGRRAWGHRWAGFGRRVWGEEVKASQDRPGSTIGRG